MTGETIVKPGSATIKIGKEIYTSEDQLTTRARHQVMIKTLNETAYRFTNLPGALRAFNTVEEITRMPSENQAAVGNVTLQGTAKSNPVPSEEKLNSDKKLLDTCPVIGHSESVACNSQYRRLHVGDFAASLCYKLIDALVKQNKVNILS